MSELPEEGCKQFEMSGLNLFVIRKGDELRAFKNACPHRGVELNWTPDNFLTADGDYIQCGMHGALFRIDNGECIHGPCIGEFLEEIAVYQVGDNLLLP